MEIVVSCPMISNDPIVAVAFFLTYFYFLPLNSHLRGKNISKNLKGNEL